MVSPLRIIVTGLAGRFPIGGVAWDYLQYVIGFARLGHDVYYHEDTGSWPYHPVEATHTPRGDFSAQYLDNFFLRYAPALRERWHYRHLHEQSFGMNADAFAEVARTADLFVNVSGACLIPERLSTRCRKLFLDTDPGYNQIVLSERFPWSDNVDRWCATVMSHDAYFTYGENIHGPDCQIPTLGLEWKTTRMPVVRDFWETAEAAPQARPWTTVMTWNAFRGTVVFRGVEYRSKGSEFEKVMALPGRVAVPMKVAVGGLGAPLERLAQAGWDVVEGPIVSATPAQYHAFIVESRGEFSPAKHVYVALRSGWFSCRSACYLAAGRPVVVQDTGFTAILPSGEGLLAFSSLEQAVAAMLDAEAHYVRHAAAARAIAAEHFDSGKVLTRLLDDAGA